MKKLVIPPRCEVGALIFDIVINDQLLRKLDLIGHCSREDEKIYLRSGISDRHKFAILIHEILHICTDEAGVQAEEGHIVGVANLLAQALLSLGIELNFSEIIEEEKK